MMPSWLSWFVWILEVIGPAVLVDTLAGRHRWHWAFGAVVDGATDDALWGRVRAFRWANAALALAACLGGVGVGIEHGIFAVGAYWILVIVLWVLLARTPRGQARQPAAYVVEFSHPAWLSVLRPGWELALGLVVLLPVALTPMVAAHLPERIPMHFGPSGVDRMGSPAELYLVVGVNVFMQLLLIAFMRFEAKQPTPRVPVERADAILALCRKERALLVTLLRWVRLMFGLSLTGIWAAIVIVGVTGRPDWMWIMVACLIALDPILLCIVGLALFRLMDLRVQMKSLGFDPAVERSEGYIWGGALYFNRRDLSVWVPKRIGVGWTLNMARPQAWIFLGAIFGLAGGVLGLSIMFS